MDPRSWLKRGFARESKAAGIGHALSVKKAEKKREKMKGDLTASLHSSEKRSLSQRQRQTVANYIRFLSPSMCILMLDEEYTLFVGKREQ